MKKNLLFWIFLFFLCFKSICFSQNLQKNVVGETDTFFVWEELNLEDAENTGFVYQDCDFMNVLLGSVQLGIIRPFANDSLQMRLSQEDFLKRINQNNISNKIILKNKVKCQFDKIIHQEILAISIYSVTRKLICTLSYQELKQNLLLDNLEAMICLVEGLKIPLVEVFDNYSFKTTVLRKRKIVLYPTIFCSV